MWEIVKVARNNGRNVRFRVWYVTRFFAIWQFQKLGQYDWITSGTGFIVSPPSKIRNLLMEVWSEELTGRNSALIV